MTVEDLPSWMRASRREIDWPLLVALVVCLAISGPLIFRTGLPRSAGAQLALAETIEMAESLHGGAWYPRWAPDYNYGFGSPLWNYQPPLSRYLTALHQVFSGASAEISVKTGYVLALVLIGLGMTGFVRRRWGTYAGLVALFACLYSPQVSLVKPYLEGDLEGLLVYGLFLTGLWIFDRLLDHGGGWQVVAAGGATTGLLLTSVPQGIVLITVICGWLVWRRMWAGAQSLHLGLAAVTGFLGTLVGSFFWLPAWYERFDAWWKTVHTYPLESWEPVPLREILLPPERLDLSAINPGWTHSLGLLVWALASVAVVLSLVRLWRSAEPEPRAMTRGEALQARLAQMPARLEPHEKDALYFALVGLIALVFVTPLGGRIWPDGTTWHAFYPRDLLVLVTVCGAIIAGQLGYRLQCVAHSRAAHAGMALLLVGTVTLALPTLYPTPWPARQYSEPDLPSIVRNDPTRGFAVPSLTTHWALPEAVANVPQPSVTLLESYRTPVIDRIRRDDLPASAKVDVIDHNPTSEHFLVRTSEPIRLTLYIFDYPGWQAEIDSGRATILPETGSGLISIDIPGGQHEVTVYFGTVPVRTQSWILSGMALLTLLLLGWQTGRDNRGLVVDPGSSGPSQNLSNCYRPSRLVHAVAVGAVALGVGVAWGLPSRVTYRSAPGVVARAEVEFPRVLQGGVDLLAYDIDGAGEVGPGDTVSLTLYWRAFRPDLPDYQVDVMLVPDEAPEQAVRLAQHRHPGLIPSSQWTIWPLLDYYVRDRYLLEIGEEVQEGSYHVVIQMGACSQLSVEPCDVIVPLFVRDGKGSVYGQRIVLPDSIDLVH